MAEVYLGKWSLAGLGLSHGILVFQIPSFGTVGSVFFPLLARFLRCRSIVIPAADLLAYPPLPMTFYSCVVFMEKSGCLWLLIICVVLGDVHCFKEAFFLHLFLDQ